MDDDPRYRLTPEQKAVFDMAHHFGQRWVTDDAFAECFKTIVKDAKQSFERDGQHPHVLVFYLRDEETGKMTADVVQLADWPPPAGKKELALMGLGVKIAENNMGQLLVMVAHISEGWAANQKDLEASGKDYIADMSDDSRIEVLIVSLTTQDLRQSYATWQINRDASGKFTGWNLQPELEDLYDPLSEMHPLTQGDFVPHGVIKGYTLARKKEREHPSN
jgi:hypothetical protein